MLCGYKPPLGNQVHVHVMHASFSPLGGDWLYMGIEGWKVCWQNSATAIRRPGYEANLTAVLKIATCSVHAPTCWLCWHDSGVEHPRGQSLISEGRQEYQLNQSAVEQLVGQEGAYLWELGQESLQRLTGGGSSTCSRTESRGIACGAQREGKALHVSLDMGGPLKV